MMLGVIQLLKKNIDGVFFMKSGAIFGYPVCQLLRMRTLDLRLVVIFIVSFVAGQSLQSLF